MHPEVGDARHYAALSYEAYVVARGANSPQALKTHAYMLEPHSHPASQVHAAYSLVDPAIGLHWTYFSCY